jgi:hypothetical protein
MVAQKVQILLLCDLDDGNVDAEETLQFSLDNQSYEVDVCAEHAEKIRNGLGPFVAQARKISGAPASSRRQRPANNRLETASIRSWAKDHGIHINERGRIPASVVKEYEAAH